MRHLVFIVVLLAASASSGFAQECCYRSEVFAGYSFLSADAKTDGIISTQFDSRYAMSRTGYGVPLNGFNLAVNITRKVGLVVDYSHNKKALIINALTLGQTTFPTAEAKINTNLFLFGARFNNRSEGSNFFGEAMIGGFNRRVEAEDIPAEDAPLVNPVKLSRTDLAFALGGGADMAMGKHLAIRIFQVDYILARGKADAPAGENRLSNNFRFQIGVVFRWGHMD
jgi:opacity protein-like surface antigen